MTYSRLHCKACGYPVFYGILPFAPLRDYLLLSYGQNHSAWERATSMSRSLFIRNAKSADGGTITVGVAERACDKLGVHPTELWPDFYELAGFA